MTICKYAIHTLHIQICASLFRLSLSIINNTRHSHVCSVCILYFVSAQFQCIFVCSCYLIHIRHHSICLPPFPSAFMLPCSMHCFLALHFLLSSTNISASDSDFLVSFLCFSYSRNSLINTTHQSISYGSFINF